LRLILSGRKELINKLSNPQRLSRCNLFFNNPHIENTDLSVAFFNNKCKEILQAKFHTGNSCL
jgi:hypothetical protein